MKFPHFIEAQIAFIAEITLGLEMLVRSYDPCISCSTHLVRL